MKRNRWMMGFTACLLAFTVYLSLDTFVLSSAYQTDATEMNLEMIREAEQNTKGDPAAASPEPNIVASETAEGTAEEETSAADSGNENNDSTGDEKEENLSDSSSSQKNTEGSSSGSGAGGEKSESSKKKKKGSRPGTAGGSGHTGSSASSDGGSHSDGTSSGSSDSGASESGKPSGSNVGRSNTGGSTGRSNTGGSHTGGNSNSGGRSSGSFDAEAAAEEAAAVTTDNAGDADTYEDENVKITYTQYTTNGTTIHVADVQLSSAEYLKTAFADDTYGKNVKASTSEIAAANDAILAINGDYYGVQESGYVIRNGIVYRETAGTNEVLCIYADGSMKVVDPSTVTAQELVEQGVWQAFSFGPGLLEDGEISVALNSEVGKAKASNPRTAIGIIDDLHYVFVVSDGRSGESEGLSLYELATFMDQLGVETAYNLDGGGSSTMVFQGNVVNDPSGGMGGHGDQEREVSDIVYIG